MPSQELHSGRFLLREIFIKTMVDGGNCKGLQSKWLRTAIKAFLGPDYLPLSSPLRTTLHATEPAITGLGLQSPAWGPDYLQLNALAVLGPSFLVLTRMRLWRAPRRSSCLVVRL